MPTPFATLEARVNASVLARLANVRVTLGGEEVDGIFTNAHAVAAGGMGMATTVPAVTVDPTKVPESPVGQTVTIGTVTYAIAAHEPDETGLSVLVLERTS